MKTKYTLHLALQALLKMSDTDYAALVEKCGLDFANYYTCNNQWSVNYLVKTAAYWNWWKSQMRLRDEVFLAKYRAYAGLDAEETLLGFYMDENSPVHVESYPNPHLLAHAWENMLEKVNSEKGGMLI